MSAGERLRPGDQVDDFLVWEPLHSGGQSTIYRVTGPSDDAPLLMKVPRLRVGDYHEGLIGFETESLILPQLSGTHVPRFVGAGDLRRVPYIVLEQIEGQSVSDWVAKSPLPPEEVAKIGAAIADAIHDLHRQDAVHCDLKPDNVMLRPGGEAVLIDFGFAWHKRFPDLLAEENVHAAGSTPYVSPEQLLGVRGDPRSDVYSLGVILYELATGELPFGIPATEGGVKQRLWMDPEPPLVLARVPPHLQEIILRCLEPEADRRYQSAAHVAFDLRNPGQVLLTARAFKSKQDGLFLQMRRWWRAKVQPMEPPAAVRRPLDDAKVLLVAVDTTHFDDERQPAIQRAARQMLSLSGEYRLVCASVIAGDATGPIDAQALELEHLVRLRNWTEPLGLPPEQLSLHVLVAAQPSGALVEFARRNHVDLIVLGAPRPGQQALGWWRSVASGVTANAHCSVHVVRVPEP